MMERRFTLEELEELSGISRRMIRHYITQKLVKGSLERGPKAVYSEGTLKRLRLIAQLRESKVEPLGRPITTSEMRTLLQTVGEEGLEQIAAGVPIKLFDTIAAKPLPMGSASDYLDSVSANFDMPDDAPLHAFQETPTRTRDGLESLLQGLLAEIEGALDDNKRNPQADWERWRKAGQPGLEIQIRVPRDEDENYRLALLAGELRALLRKL